MYPTYFTEADGSPLDASANRYTVIFAEGQAPPDDASRANWLPAPDGPFYTVLRLYGPDAEVLDGTWTPPPVVRKECTQ